MKEITKRGERRMTLRQIAEATGAAYSTVAAYAQKAGWTANGKQTVLDEKQATIIVEAMKQPVSSGAKSNLLFEIEGVKSGMSRALRIEMHRKAIEKELEAEIAELEQENASLRQDNTRLQIKADAHETYLTVKRVAKLNNMPWSSLDWKRVKRSSNAMELDWQKADDLNYGKCNAYHIDAWRDAYPSLNYGVVL